VDYKNGKVVWDNSHNWDKPDDYYRGSQDILLVQFGKCQIDVGNYVALSGFGFVIMVLDLNTEEPWKEPYAVIPCTDLQDLLSQLRRAVDSYPALINKLAHET
jgi:hypothetical protein